MYRGKAKSKADVTIIMSDDVFVQVADGSVSLLNSHGATDLILSNG